MQGAAVLGTRNVQIHQIIGQQVLYNVEGVSSESETDGGRLFRVLLVQVNGLGDKSGTSNVILVNSGDLFD